MKAKTIRDIRWDSQRVFVRVDFNVPIGQSQTIEDPTRIEAALPTIRYLLEQKLPVILGSHLGRPKGKTDPKYSLRPVAEYLSRVLKQEVVFAPDCVGPEVESLAGGLGAGQVLLLENLRFHSGEEENDPAFAARLAKLADAYVNDAFGTAHRAHASTEGMARLLPIRAAGLLMERELTYLGEKTSNPERPFVVILGGAKVSDKIKVIDALLDRADEVLIGGAMAYTFKLALGQTVGDSLCEPDQVETARDAMNKAMERGVKFLLPEDTLCTDKLDFGNRQLGNTKVVSGDIPDGWEGVDIGPATIELYCERISSAKTILWNGPMGISEIEASSHGTVKMAHAVAASEGLSIIGGGDSVLAVHQSGVAEEIDFISTGGGASLEFLEGRKLPGVAVLEEEQ